MGKNKNGTGKLSQWAKIKIVCKVVRGTLRKAHTMGYLTVPGQEVSELNLQLSVYVYDKLRYFLFFFYNWTHAR